MGTTQYVVKYGCGSVVLYQRSGVEAYDPTGKQTDAKRFSKVAALKRASQHNEACRARCARVVRLVPKRRAR